MTEPNDRAGMAGGRTPRIAPEAVGFQSDASAAEYTPVPLLARSTIWLIMLALLAVVAWATVARLDRVVVSNGRLVTAVPNLVVQPLETSIVRRILVEPGQIVRRGEILAELDPTFAASDFEMLERRRDAAEARLARLGAEVEHRPFIPGGDATRDEIVQLALFDQRRREFDLKVETGSRRLDELDATLNAARASSALLADQLRLARELEEMRERLHGRGVVSQVELLEVRQRRLEIELSQKLARDRIVELSHQIEALRAQREAFVVEWNRTTTEQMITTGLEYDEIVEELAKAKRRTELATLRAPEDTVVLEIGDRSADSIVREAEALFTLVPLGSALEAEVEIDAADIGHVAAGDTVRVKLNAFPFQRHGLLEGELRTVSEDALRSRQSASGAPFDQKMYYRARIALITTELRNVSDGRRLMPGMQVTAEIQIGRRRVISYFLYPLIRVLDESLREPA